MINASGNLNPIQLIILATWIAKKQADAQSTERKGERDEKCANPNGTRFSRSHFGGYSYGWVKSKNPPIISAFYRLIDIDLVFQKMHKHLKMVFKKVRFVLRYF